MARVKKKNGLERNGKGTQFKKQGDRNFLSKNEIKNPHKKKERKSAKKRRRLFLRKELRPASCRLKGLTRDKKKKKPDLR